MSLTSPVDDPLDKAIARVAAALDLWPVRVGLFLWIVIYALAPLTANPRHGGSTPDWQFFQFFEEVARKTILEFRQFPIWDPYYCGGQTLVGNPQTTYLVPTLPLVLLFGTTMGMRLSIFVVLVVGCEGGWRLVRQLGMGRAAALVGALAFPLFGRTWGWLTDGQYGLHGTVLETWILYGFVRGIDRPAALATGGAFLAWLLAFRGIQPGPQMALALGLWAAMESVTRWRKSSGLTLRDRVRSSLWPLGACAILGLLGAGFVGIRIVPVLQAVLSHPRVVAETARRTMDAAWFEIYALPDSTPGWGASGYAYIGKVTYAFAALTLCWDRARRRAYKPILVTLFFFAAQLGYSDTHSLYGLLKSLPLYKSLRNPTLYSFTAALFLVVTACYSLDEIAKIVAGLRWRALKLVGTIAVAALALAPGIDEAIRGNQILSRPHIFTFPPVPTIHDEFRQARGNYWMAPLWPSVDRGTLSCYDETPWVNSGELAPDRAAEEYLAEPDAGTVTRDRWTPNRIDLSTKLTRRSLVLINQNWDPGWHALGGTIVNRRLQLGVEVGPGETHVVLWYWPMTATVGLAWCLFALCATAWLLRRQRRADGTT